MPPINILVENVFNYLSIEKGLVLRVMLYHVVVRTHRAKRSFWIRVLGLSLGFRVLAKPLVWVNISPPYSPFTPVRRKNFEFLDILRSILRQLRALSQADQWAPLAPYKMLLLFALCSSSGILCNTQPTRVIELMQSHLHHARLHLDI